MSATDPVILSAARTPFGRFGGVFRDLSAVELGTVAARAALERARIGPDDVDTAVFGQIYQGGAGMNPARQVAMGVGVPNRVPAMTINQVCASGLQAIALAAQAIRLGEAEVALAGGMESMSQVPYVLPDARWGARLGHARQLDARAPRRPLGRLPQLPHGHHRRGPRRGVRHHARGAGRIRATKSATLRRGSRCLPLRG